MRKAVHTVEHRNGIRPVSNRWPCPRRGTVDVYESYETKTKTKFVRFCMSSDILPDERNSLKNTGVDLRIPIQVVQVSTLVFIVRVQTFAVYSCRSILRES